MDASSKSLEEMSGFQLTSQSTTTVPPGFRFHPTDEELVGYYLTKKVASSKIDLDVIRDVDLYKLEPWDLQERCRIGSAEQHEWYFFSHKDKKYPTGTRTNRATTAGFWKATGRDKPIFAKVKLIGMRKTLVFYKGRAPNGQKSDWIMHEYRLEDDINNTATNEEGWVVCRVFKKRSIIKKPGSDLYDCYVEDPEKAAAQASSTGVEFVKQELLESCSGSGVYKFPFSFDHPFSQLPRLEESPKRSSELVQMISSHPPSISSPVEEDPSASFVGSSYHQLDLEELVQLHSRSFHPSDDQASRLSNANLSSGFNEESVVSQWGMMSEEERSIAGAGAEELIHHRASFRGNQQDYLYDSVDLWGFNR